MQFREAIYSTASLLKGELYTEYYGSNAQFWIYEDANSDEYAWNG